MFGSSQKVIHGNENNILDHRLGQGNHCYGGTLILRAPWLLDVDVQPFPGPRSFICLLLVFDNQEIKLFVREILVG